MAKFDVPHGGKEKKEAVSDPRQKFDKLSYEAEELYGLVFASNFVDLKGAAEDFGDINVNRVKYLTLKTYQKEVTPVVSKFLKSMTGCKKACKGLEKRFRAMIDLAENHPELLKWERFVDEINETESRINDALVKLEKYEEMLFNVQFVIDACPSTTYNPLKAMYQTAQRPVLWGWKKVIGKGSRANKAAAWMRYNLGRQLHKTFTEDE